MLPTRHIWFPLRSNLAFFETGTGRMALEARAKQMAILCDELWFEGGVVTVDVARDFVMGPMWYPPGSIPPDDLAKMKAARKGSRFYFALGMQPAPGEPAPPDAMRTIGGGPRQRVFVGDYEELLLRSKLGHQPWVHPTLIRPEAAQAAQVVADAWGRFDTGYGRDAPKPSKNSLLNSTLKKSLNHDLATAETLGMPTTVDRLHKRMLVFKAKTLQAISQELDPVEPPGSDTLSVWVPDFSDRPWRDIIALHDHDAIGSFREKLIEAEMEVAPLRGRARTAALAQIGMREEAEALRRHFPSRKRRAADVAFEAISGLVLGRLAPLVGITKQAAGARRAEQEWTAVYLALTERKL
jgi:hypothetical protein